MLIDIATLKERWDYAMISFVNDIISQGIDSISLLSKFNFYAPTRPLRNRNLFAVEHHRTNYAKFGPLNQMMTIYNQHCEMIDFNMPRVQLKKYFKNHSNHRT